MNVQKKTICQRRYRGSVKVRWFQLSSPCSPLTSLPQTSTHPCLAQKPSLAHIPFSWNLPSNSAFFFPKVSSPCLVFPGTKYDHEGQKTSSRNLEKENPTICHSVEEGEETRKPNCFPCSCARKKLNQSRKRYQNMRRYQRRRQNQKGR